MREQYQMRAGKQKGEWVSSNPAVLSVDGKGLVTALREGQASISLTDQGKVLMAKDFLVQAQADVPESIQAAIDLALSEWQAAFGKTFKRGNKYTKWYYGPSASFGWCGAFTAYSLGVAGVPQAKTNTFKKLKPLDHGQPYGVREAGVPKLLEGYNNLDRITNIPRPGYLVIYGKRGGYKTIHVGLVTQVVDHGDGTYTIETAEGNLSSRVKRLSYLYDSRLPSSQQNISVLPEADRTQNDVFQYALARSNWVITCFAQTWY